MSGSCVLLVIGSLLPNSSLPPSYANAHAFPSPLNLFYSLYVSNATGLVRTKPASESTASGTYSTEPLVRV